MNDSFLFKGLQGAVDGYPVVLMAYFFFYIAMCKRIIGIKKQGQNLSPAFGGA
jgi:hypothetical protein